jgi:hypothetical protein
MWSVFRKVSEGALFCPMPKMIEAPSFEGAFLVSETPHIGKTKGVGVLVTVGVWLER